MSISIRLKNIISILEYVLIIFVVVGNNTMFERDTAYGISETVLTTIFSVICFILFALNNLSGTKIFKTRDIYKFVFLVLISFGIIITPGASRVSGLLHWLIPVFFCALYFMSKYNTEDIWEKFVNVIVIIAIISLFLFFFGSILHILPVTRTASYLYDGNYRTASTYFGLQYNVQSLSWLPIYRNTSFFIEAPMYNIVLCIAFAAEAAFRKRVRKWVLVILGITILSTLTTTGILFLLIMLGVFIIMAGRGKKARTVIIFLIPEIILIGIFLTIIIVNWKTLSVSGNNSFSIRMDHMIASFKMWIYRPLLGYGYGNSSAFFEFTTYDQGMSVGLPGLLGRNGCLIFLMYLVPFINRIRYSVKNDTRQLYFWIGTGFCFFMTASIYKTIFILLLCAQLMWKDKTQEEYFREST